MCSNCEISSGLQNYNNIGERCCLDSRWERWAAAAARPHTNTASLDKQRARPLIRSSNKALRAVLPLLNIGAMLWKTRAHKPRPY